jgi:multidrug efflux pump subunit AcrB
MKSGFAGKIAEMFINSKLTPLLMISFLIIGFYTASLTPREEEPQIEVPIADIFLGYPGATPKEVDVRVTKPIEKIISNIKGVEHVYSTSANNGAMLIVQFYVGEDVEKSLVKLYNELMRHMDQLPDNVTQPLVKSRAIDDVPVLGLTFWSDKYDDFQIRRMIEEFSSEITQIEDIAQVKVIGGRSREIKVKLNKSSMAAWNIDPLMIVQKLQQANEEIPGGKFSKGNYEYSVVAGEFFQTTEDLKNLVISAHNGTPVYLRQVATIEDGPQDPTQYVSFGYGKSSKKRDLVGDHQAVTLSIAKRKGADAMGLSDLVLQKFESLKGEIFPSAVHMEVTRNYGESASHKVTELMWHLIGSILAVTIVVALSMGWRGGLVVFLSVPVTFALTLFIYYIYGYTLNRITLFALVFVTGIVVDDSIIIAENMHRHFKLKRLPFYDAAIASINEVGNPTILATFTVIAAVLPMIAVSGMMGPYMSPMPIGASFAMMFSLFVALVITPYIAFRLLKVDDDEEDFKLETTFFYRLFKYLMMPMMKRKALAYSFLSVVGVMLLASTYLFYNKGVAVKMLPFDNKNEFQVVVDMPEGTTLEETRNASRAIAQYIKGQENIKDYQIYTGTSSPITFNGLVRHYDVRHAANMADIQVNLTDKGTRKDQSHDIVKRLRDGIISAGDHYGANVKIVEIPPGPPVLSTLVAEIYGPTSEKAEALASQVIVAFKATEGIADVDWSLEADQQELKILIDREKAAIAGISQAQAVQALHVALNGFKATVLMTNNEFQQTPIMVRLEESQRSAIKDLMKLNIMSPSAELVALGDIATVEKRIVPKSIQRKDQKELVYVTAEVVGDLESPVYAILDAQKALEEITVPKGYNFEQLYNGKPFIINDYFLKWDGEWQITVDVFADLGAAFGVVIIVIYLLIVGWFQDFKVPLVMMVAIPLSLVGILVGHWLMGAYFTATSMIGMIALAGIMVRNSVLLIDFVHIRLDEGASLMKSVIDSVAIRTTPILLTAGTVVIGAFVILFDPIFQGLAISLMGGSIASTILTLLIVPLIYYMIERKNHVR